MRHKQQRNWRHEFGTPNPIMCAEEATMLADVDRAAISVPNQQILGRNGEIPLLTFFNRYLPTGLRAATGLFIAPSGALSPQIDLLILDGRYPLLAHNADGTVRAMLHSVLWAVEIKTRLKSRDFKRIWLNAGSIMSLAGEIPGYGVEADPISLRTSAFAYRTGQGVDATVKAFVRSAKPDDVSLGVSILRVTGESRVQRGVELVLESPFPRGERQAPQWHAVQRFTHSPLSDLYYDIVRWSYVILGQRGWTFDDIGTHIAEYMTWSTDGEPEHLQ